jgi:hypothetical protein
MALSVTGLVFDYFDFYIVGFLVAVLAPQWHLTFGQTPEVSEPIIAPIPALSKMTDAKRSANAIWASASPSRMQACTKLCVRRLNAVHGSRSQDRAFITARC